MYIVFYVKAVSWMSFNQGFFFLVTKRLRNACLKIGHCGTKLVRVYFIMQQV